METYDLVSHGTTSGQECYGIYNSAIETGTGAGYTNSCIHSGSNAYSGGDTVWYNYTIASAGTIMGTNNINNAVETICPKGWTLPAKTQINNQKNVTNFSPVSGGSYNNGILYFEDKFGNWQSSEAANGPSRHYLYYSSNSNDLYTSNAGRFNGLYIRCVSEEKTVTDLTYMQYMTPTF